MEKISASEVFDRELFIRSVRQIVSATTDLPGADCVLYAGVGAALLSRLGFVAEPAAGSAAWRVGAGDADTISHASEIAGPVFSPATPGKLGGMFHAWIRVHTEGGTEIVDLTTWQLKKKGRELDAADGGTTVVDFCPEFLWISESSEKLLSPRDVVQSFDTGVFAYLRKPEIERHVFNNGILEESDHMAMLAHLCYQSGKSGQKIQVVGLDNGEPSEVNDDTPMKLRQVKRM